MTHRPAGRAARSVRVFALVALALAAASRTEAQVELTTPDWMVTGLDLASWNGSALVFEVQAPAPGGHDVSGYFDWYSNGVFRGRELFRGTLSSALRLEIQGYQLVNPVAIQLGRYHADVTPDGLRIANGTWQGLSSPVTGTWAAARDPGHSTFCFGDAASCPCANAGLPGHGCENARATGGARLDVASYAPAGAGLGHLGLLVSALPAGTDPTVVLLRSTSLAQGPAAFGDGILCLGGGSPMRLAASLASNGGSRFSLSHVAGPGVHYYQALYRSHPAPFCSAADAFNTSNAVAAIWP